MAAIDSLTELTSLLETWEVEEDHARDVVPTLVRLSELIEMETEAYYKIDPDPFDDRHPGRADPTCALGHLLKAVLKKDTIMTHLVDNYLLTSRNQTDLQIASCRLLLNLLPGLETTVVFQENESVVAKLFSWAETADEPLRSYATGLLAGAMESQDIAGNFKDHNAVLVPLMLQRLRQLKTESQRKKEQDKQEGLKKEIHIPERPFAIVANTSQNQNGWLNEDNVEHALEKDRSRMNSANYFKRSPTKDTYTRIRNDSFGLNDCSNSSWAEQEPFVIGPTYSLHPLTLEMQQKLVLQYLAPMGEYQELLVHMFEHRAKELIFHYINLKENTDVRLAFAALKYLGALLCHKKFATEFITEGGIQRLLTVPRPSVASTGVSMCFYYLAYFEDAMERVCQLPHAVLSDMVSYMLWLLECSHESGRCHATMFFGLSFPFRVILELFDKKDGLRKLFNVISTLPILDINVNEDNLSEDHIFTCRQACRHVSVAFKKYFEGHLAIKAEHIRRNYLRGEMGSSLIDVSETKAAKYSQEVIQENMDILLEYMPMKIQWEPVASFVHLGGVTLLLQLVAMSPEWGYYTGKAETLRSALDTLAICVTCPKVQLSFVTDMIPLPDILSTQAISIIFGLVEGEIVPEPDVQKSALQVVGNCVCGPIQRLSRDFHVSGSSQKRTVSRREEVLQKMWESVRANNGIMVLLKLLMVKTPITDADSLRALACKALLGLSRSENLRQIISKLPLFNNGQLQQLMKEPVLQDKRREHVKFCKYASELTERVSGKSTNPTIDASLEQIRRADIVAQTRIHFNDKELLQLIQEHLITKGYSESARVLAKEANLPNRCTTPPTVHPESVQIYATPPPGSKVSRHLVNTPGQSHPTPSTSSHVCTNTGSKTAPVTPGGPIKINIISSKTNTPHRNSTPPSSKNLQKLDTDLGSLHSTALIRQPSKHYQECSEVSLNKIVSEYLREQHALCKNPMVTCPSFSLLTPHRCPDPKKRNTAPANITARMITRTSFPPYGGIEGARADRKYVYSRFRPVRTYRDTDEDGCWSCCAFSVDQQFLMLGTYAGDLKLVNMQTAEEAGSYVCHRSPLNNIQQSRDGRLVLTSSSWSKPLSALWTMGDFFDMKHSFENDNYMQFSNQTQDRIIGTQETTAHIYDVTTGGCIMTLHDPDKANYYTRNRATFNSTDDLVLNDGVLWDMTSGKAIHKFDKFNPHVSGVFHPMGLEIIINSEVWDLRTFHLLHTVPALDQCQIRFNTAGNIIYGAMHQLSEDEELSENTVKSPYGSSFRTFDASDYTNIATIDVKKDIFDLCSNDDDTLLAVIENQKMEEELSEESVCHLYEVGCVRNDDEEQEEEEEEEEDGGLDDDDDDDDLLDDDDDEHNSNEEDNGDEDDDNGDDDDEADDDLDGTDDAYEESDSSTLDDDILFELSSDMVY